VSIATFGYGVCLVSFGLAFAYLLKDGIRTEAVAIGAGLFGLLVFFTIGRFAVPFTGDYSVNVMLVGEMGTRPLDFRTSLPFVGPLMALALLGVLGATAAFFYDHFKRDDKIRKWGWRLFRTAAVVQGLVLVALFVQVKNVTNVGQNIPAREQQIFTETISKLSERPVTLEQAKQTLAANPQLFKLSMSSNPVEFGALIGLFVALLMVALFAWRRQDVMSALPALSSIDSMLYRTVGVAFPLLTLLLITGAVWANESWGRYWGWDSKEVGALVAWMAYAGFLHTRIAHGWRGRRSAYFALLGFALVIFTWLGVSFLLPGLHSYAGV
jgi:cytochrome c-type biogenesis protein CcsB